MKHVNNCYMETSFQLIRDCIEENLLTHLTRWGAKGPDKEVYKYSLIPAGKLFRPTLAYLAYLETSQVKIDLENTNAVKQIISDNFQAQSNISLIGSFLECHHVYTLIHDDLPAMDNDNFRRGREASHIKFGEWKALLAGDGLNIFSFHLLSHLKGDQALNFMKIATKSTGPQGLIFGQYLDLSQMMKESFENLKQTHHLKTARLIQLALLGGQFAFQNQINEDSKDFWKLGYHLGMVFQYLDDLDDLREENEHEQAINPWKNYPDETYQSLIQSISSCEKRLSNKKIMGTYIKTYLDKNISILKNHQQEYLAIGISEKNLLNIISALNLTSNH